MMKRIYIILYTVLIVLTAFSCDHSDEETQPGRTILVYMVAENNLSGFGYQNIDKMLEGVNVNSLNNGNLLVYFDPANDVPQLLQIKVNKQGVAEKVVITSYPEENSASPETLTRVIDEVMADSRFQSDSYGLILWSHATAWLPGDWSSMLRSFGDDKGRKMEIYELADAIPDHLFDFIIFDCCYMSSIEVIYELRDKADYIIASPTEIMGNGFPYDLIITPLFKNTADLVGVCENFFNYYDKKSGLERSATIALIDTKALDNLKNATRAILQGKAADVKAMNVTGIQPMDRLSSRRTMLYDYDDFIVHFASDETAYTAFSNALAKAIIYKRSTPNSTYSLGGGSTLPMTHFSGMNSYILQDIQVELNDWYTQLDWYKAVY